MKPQLVRSLIAACLITPVALGAARTAPPQDAGHSAARAGAIVETVRTAIARFRDVNDAIAAGYEQFQGCVSGPLEGAMGVHFANGALFDGKIDPQNPEVLVYEPRKGRLELVAAEYIVPAEFWDPVHDDYDKPHLLGQLYHYAPSPNRYGGGPFYELHVWAAKHNPRGTFADWNPNVSCADWVRRSEGEER